MINRMATSAITAKILAGTPLNPSKKASLSDQQEQFHLFMMSSINLITNWNDFTNHALWYALIDYRTISFSKVMEFKDEDISSVEVTLIPTERVVLQ